MTCRYYHAGDGPPLLLLHGLAVTADTWLLNIEALAEHFTVIAPDLPGRGMTGPLDLDGDVPQKKEIEFLLALVDRLGIEEVSVVGSSYGGLLGALLFLARPALVERLVIVGSGSCSNSEERQAKMLANVHAHAEAAFAPTLTLRDLRDRFARIVHDPACLPDAMLYLLASFSVAPEAGRAYREILEALMDFDRTRPYRIYGRFAEVTLPVLVLNGKEDILSSWEASRQMVAMMPDARLEVWENCGHLPYVEYPDRFHDAIFRFCLQRPYRRERSLEVSSG